MKVLLGKFAVAVLLAMPCAAFAQAYPERPTTWYGIYAPKGTPREQIHWLHARFREAMDDAQFTAKLAEQGYMLLRPELTSPEALASHTRSEGSLSRKVIADAGIPPN